MRAAAMRIISPLADRPGTFPCFVMKFLRSPPRMRAVSISTPPLAQGAIRARCLRRPGARVLALDRDPTAIAAGAALAAEAQGRLFLVEARFSQLADVAQRLHLGAFDAVILDIGVSSMQLDDASRGFSFRGDGPLDMRMQQSGQSAADIVNTADEATLADILYHFGEERASRRIARAHRARSRQGAFRLDRRARRHDRARRAGQAWRDASGDARLSGAAHRRQ